MLGAIAGDVIGSVFEGSGVKALDFPLFDPSSTFTDDTVMTIAVAAAILDGRPYDESLRAYGRRHPNRGYGAHFKRWLTDPRKGPYNSWGNGSAMRVSAVGWAFDDEARVLEEAKRSAEVTRDHPEGIRGAQAVALAVLLARQGHSKATMREKLGATFDYDLHRSADEIRPRYVFDVSCQGSVPESIVCFLDSVDVESAIRLAISLGGDADTMACIAGAIAEAHYGEVPESIVHELRRRLTPELLDVVDRFETAFRA